MYFALITICLKGCSSKKKSHLAQSSLEITKQLRGILYHKKLRFRANLNPDSQLLDYQQGYISSKIQVTD